jgi:hypothetical protein
MIKPRNASLKFYLFAFLIFVFGVVDFMLFLKPEPPASPPATVQPATQPTSRCFAGETVVVGFEPFHPLLVADSTGQPRGFARDVVEGVLRGIECPHVVWQPLRINGPEVDLVAAPPAMINALLQSGNWTSTAPYALIDLQVVKRKSATIDSTSSVVVDQTWFPLVHVNYPKAQAETDALIAYFGKPPAAAIVPTSKLVSFDKQRFENLPIPIHLALAVAKKRGQSLEALNTGIKAGKALIETAAKNHHITDLQPIN